MRHWFISFLLFFICQQSFAAPPAILSKNAIYSPTVAKQAMVVTSDKIASEIGLQVLQQGGNAVDAAVTIGFTLAVTLPRAGNIGGGGFMLIHDAKTGNVVAVDYREKAPRNAHKDMYLDKAGNPDNQLSRFSHLAVGVPGTVAGLALALEKYGSLSLAQALQPAIKLAEKGFPMHHVLRDSLLRGEKRLKKSAETSRLFFKEDGSAYALGEQFVQPELASTLKQIAEQGVSAFYEGEIAKKIAADMAANNGLITLEDLKAYRPAIRQPIHGTYRGYDVYSMSPPSSGGVHIVQILNILEQFSIKEFGHNSQASLHVMAEAMKRAYADRSEYLGDTDFVNVPLKGLTSKAYAKSLATQIPLDKATPSKSIAPANPLPYESNETTHFSVIDKAGNAVANTYTLNFSFGSGLTAKGTGFLLNNEMDDFSAKAGVPNAYGLIGNAANAIAPEKRMLSSMSPTIVMHNQKPFLVTGSPGGSRIITTTLQVIMNVIDHGMNIQEAVNAPRVHHQWLPDEIRIEKGISIDTQRLLTEMGHTMVEKNPMGSAASILIDAATHTYYGAADPRRQGFAVGY